MNREQFKELFYSELEKAALNADEELGWSVSRDFEIQLHGAGYPGTILDPEEAFEAIWLGDKEFFVVIDVAVIWVDKECTEIFVRPAGYDPVPFEQTWNGFNKGEGPFKQMIAKPIRGQHNLDETT